MKSLRDVNRNFHDPTHFCANFKNFDGSPVNVMVQMDADEFFNNLLDKLEKELKATGSGDAISRTFGGEIVQEIICKDHDFKSERVNPFLALPVEVKGNMNLQQCLDQFIKGELLEGENQYFCDELNQKVDAFKRECIKRLPNVLIIVLKRFSFNFETMEKLKINDFCKFPDELDMKKYTQETLNEELSSEKPHDYYHYKLRGVLVHKGGADSGHYYSFIKDQNQKWYEFNDTVVRPFNENKMAEECYGGFENSNNSMGQDTSKGKNAYMLFYERKGLYNSSGEKIESLLQGLNGSITS